MMVVVVVVVVVFAVVVVVVCLDTRLNLGIQESCSFRSKGPNVRQDQWDRRHKDEGLRI
jgi:hypothetical protein